MTERLQVRQARRLEILLPPDHGDVLGSRRSLSDLHLLRNDSRAPVVPGNKELCRIYGNQSITPSDLVSYLLTVAPSILRIVQ